jgi:hypothetical protein
VDFGPDLTVFTGNKTLLTQWEVDEQVGLTEVTGTLYIYPYSGRITNLDALSSLTSVGGFVLDNTTVPNLDGLSSLTSVGGYLEVISNDALMNLDGLSGVTSVGEGLLVHRNAVLGNCSSIAELLRSGGVTGTITIEDNAPGCNSIEEILASAPTPEEQLEDLADMVQDLRNADALNRGQANALQSKLDGTAAAFERGNTRAAINKLEAFINAVNALVRSRRLEPQDGDNLIDAAQALIDSISP